VGLVAPEVHGLLGGGAVMAEAVGLDDEAESGPEEVDSIATQTALGLGWRDAGLADDREEAPLERVRRATEGLRVEDPLQPTDARTGRLILERRAEVGRADQVEAVGLVDGIFDVGRAQFHRQVDEDRDRIADRDATDEPRWPKVRAPVQADPPPPRERRAWDGDVDRPACLLPDAPEIGGAAVTQPSTLATGQGRALEATKALHLRSSDGVDPGPKPVQLATLKSPSDLPRRHPELEQLPPRHHPVLPARQIPGRACPRLNTFGSHGAKSVQATDLAPAPAGGTRCLRDLRDGAVANSRPD
jgi:hypothetical protein